jgi:hypothetical protein
VDPLISAVDRHGTRPSYHLLVYFYFCLLCSTIWLFSRTDLSSYSRSRSTTCKDSSLCWSLFHFSWVM